MALPHDARDCLQFVIVVFPDPTVFLLHRHLRNEFKMK